MKTQYRKSNENAVQIRSLTNDGWPFAVKKDSQDSPEKNALVTANIGEGSWLHHPNGYRNKDS